MAKHKTRKSTSRIRPPPPKKAEETPPQPPDIADTPPEPAPSDAGTPPPAPIDFNTRDKNRKLDQLYWMRIILAVAAGVSAAFIFEPFEGEEKRWASIGYMIILFLVTVFIAKSMRIPLPPSDRKKIVTQAIASYVFLYLFVWIMTYTILFTSGAIPGSNMFR